MLSRRHPHRDLHAAPRSTAVARRAFTLAEALIVITLIGVLAAIVSPQVAQQLSHGRVNQAAAVVAAELEQAVSMAARQRKPVRMTFDATQIKYTITDRASGTQLQQRSLNTDSGFGLTTLTGSPSVLDIFPSGISSAPLTVTVGVSGYTRQVTMSTAGQVRVVP